MKFPAVKMIASLLVLTVASLALVQPRADAMLAPATMVHNSPQVDRAADMKTIQSSLENKMVRQRLHALGLSEAEIQSRLSRMSDSQVHQMASQIRSINPAGDGWVVGILVVVLLVVLIIYLLKRI